MLCNLKCALNEKRMGTNLNSSVHVSTHLSAILIAYPLTSVVLGLPQHSTHHVLVLIARRQFTLSLLLLLEVNKSPLCD